MSYADVKARSVRLSDSTTNEVVLTSSLATLYNGTNRMNIAPTTISCDGELILTNTNFSGTTTGFTVALTDNSRKIATTAFVKGQVTNLTGYARLDTIQNWSATQNFTTITASTPATSDNSSTVATTAYVKANPAVVTLPIVLGSTGVLTTLGQSILYSVSGQTINSTSRCYAPSGYLAPGTYIMHMFIYAQPASYNVVVIHTAASATPLTNGQSSGLDFTTYSFGSGSTPATIDDTTTYREFGNKTVTNGLFAFQICPVITIVSSRPYIGVLGYMNGSTTNAIVQLKITRIA